jgi:hypothetical protein
MRPPNGILLVNFATPMQLKDLQEARRKQVIELLCRHLRAAAASKSASGGAEDEGRRSRSNTSGDRQWSMSDNRHSIRCVIIMKAVAASTNWQTIRAFSGWNHVIVIDDDLGKSGASSAGRTGFQRLVAEVGLGKVGAVLSIEVSRFAHNNAKATVESLLGLASLVIMVASA